MVPGRIAAALVQLEITGIRLQHGANGNGEKPLDDEPAIFSGQFADRLECKLQCRIARLPTRVFFELKYQRGHQIECLMNARKLFQQRGHSEVVFGPVQIRPWHDVGSPHKIFVKRLMHMPQK